MIDERAKINLYQNPTSSPESHLPRDSGNMRSVDRWRHVDGCPYGIIVFRTESDRMGN